MLFWVVCHRYVFFPPECRCARLCVYWCSWHSCTLHRGCQLAARMVSVLVPAAQGRRSWSFNLCVRGREALHNQNFHQFSSLFPTSTPPPPQPLWVKTIDLWHKYTSSYCPKMMPAYPAHLQCLMPVMCTSTWLHLRGAQFSVKTIDLWENKPPCWSPWDNGNILTSLLISRY